MRLVLRADVDGVGKTGDIVDVADGYGRNYLIPRQLAFRATDGVVAQAGAMRRSRDVKDARDRAGAEEIARRLVAEVVTIGAKAGAEGRLFGSVTTTDIVDAVADQTGLELDRRRLHLDEPIRSVGSHQVKVRLHPAVEFQLAVEVAPA